MDENVNWELLARHLAGESSEVEEELLARADASPRHAEVLDTARRSWDACGEGLRRRDTETAWDSLRTRMQARSTPRMAGRAGRVAIAATFATFLAGGALVAALGIWGWPGAGVVAAQEWVTPRGGRDAVRLPDGTRVTLGPESRLLISGHFGEQRREMELSGEAFFQVAHDPSRPFVVHSGLTVARALGTEFNVRAYPEDSTVQVVVAVGRVSFGTQDGAPSTVSAVLVPGDLGELTTDATHVTRRRVDPAAYLGWREGRLSFENAPLSRVVVQLERWYGVPVRIGDATLRARRLTASFHDQSLEEVVAIVATSLGIEITRVGPAYTFYAKGRAAVLARQ